MSKLFVAFLLFIGISDQLIAQSMKTRLDRYFTALHNNQQFSGTVLVAQNGKVIYEHSFGYANIFTKEKNAIQTTFPVASISKTMTATAILQLSAAGKISITDPVVKYLPDFPYPGITIRHLLSHTSGLPPYNAYFDSIRKEHPDTVLSNPDFMYGVLHHPKPLVYNPGEKGNYDNINFIVLALVLEKVSGLPYQDYISKYVLEPAGMKHTLFFPLTEQYSLRSRTGFAFPHLYPHLYSDSLVVANTVPYVIAYWKGYNFNGFGDYISTTHDLLAYDQYYSRGGYLNASLLEEAYTPVKLNNGTKNPENFGLGWEIEKDSSMGKIVYHSGAATGLSCVLLRNISRKQTIILYDNSHFNAHESALKAMKVLNDEYVPLPQKSLAKLFVQVLIRSGATAARDTLFRLRSDTLHYLLSEDEMNSLGYDLLGGANNPNPFHFPEEHRYKEALETFKINTELFPDSWNTYDSYGEALLMVGRKAEAISMYKRSIELNPGNTGGLKALEQLIKKE